jgi:hypothetical protein
VEVRRYSNVTAWARFTGLGILVEVTLDTPGLGEDLLPFGARKRISRVSAGATPSARKGDRNLPHCNPT